MQNEEQVYSQPFNNSNEENEANKEDLGVALDEESHKILENYNRPKSSKFKIILFILIGIFVLSGIAYGSWYGYEKYFTTPELASLILDSIENGEKVDKFKIEYELDFELGEIGGLEVPGQLGLGSLSEILGSDNKTFSLKGSNLTDRADSENIKTENNILFRGGTAFGKIGIDSRLISNALYFKITEIPLFASMFLDSSIIKNIWIKLDIDKEKGLIEEYKDFFEEEEGSETKREKFNKEDIFDEIKKCSNEVIDNEELINCRFKFKPEGSKIYLTELREAMGKTEKLKKEVAKLDDEDWDKIYEILNKITFDFTFTKKEHYLSDLKIFYKDEESSTSVKNAVIKVVVDNFVEKVEIAVPDDAINLEDLINKVMSGAMNAMTGSQAPASFGGGMINPLGDARAKARDAKRISDIKQIITGLELCSSMTGDYPIVEEKVLLGVGNYSSIDTNGFCSTECTDLVLSKVPMNSDSETRAYTYQSLDGETYRVEFELEIGSGPYSAGLYVGTDGTIKEDIFDSIDNTQAKARDAIRMSDIKQIMTGLAIYYNKNNHYPVVVDKALLGVGDYACLGLDNFTSSDCDRYIMKKIPANPSPETREYAYQCLDGENYRLEFGLEIGSGAYSSGAYIADTGEIKIEAEAPFMKEENKNLDDIVKKDSDNDGLSDSDELNIYHTDIYNMDTDGDGYNDGDEVKAGYNPNGEGKL